MLRTSVPLIGALERIPVPEDRLSVEKKINRSLRSEVDFIEAESYAQRITQARDGETKRALLISTIVCYARPFSKNEWSPNAKAENQLPLDQYDGLTDRETALHDLIVRFRNKAVAHSEHEMNPATWHSGSDQGFSYRAKEYELEEQLPDATELEALCRKRKKQSMDLSFKLNLQLVEMQNAL